MQEIIEDGKKVNGKERKIDLKKMVKEAKDRAQNQIQDEAAYASTVVKKSGRSNKSEVKTKTTLKLGKGKAEITTEVKKVAVKKERSASAKKTATGKKLSASAKMLLLAKSRASSAKGKIAKTAPNGSRKNSGMKSGRSVLAKRVGSSRPQTQV